MLIKWLLVVLVVFAIFFMSKHLLLPLIFNNMAISVIKLNKKIIKYLEVKTPQAHSKKKDWFSTT
jgi:hypothetical protein